MRGLLSFAAISVSGFALLLAVTPANLSVERPDVDHAPSAATILNKTNSEAINRLNVDYYGRILPAHLRWKIYVPSPCSACSNDLTIAFQPVKNKDTCAVLLVPDVPRALHVALSRLGQGVYVVFDPAKKLLEPSAYARAPYLITKEPNGTLTLDPSGAHSDWPATGEVHK